MNFYKHHIGDYDAATAHLSWLEDAAYRRLMSLYYRREQPIPADLTQACRLVRAASKEEKQAVETVLNEFFTLADDGWHSARCDEEIELAQAKATKNRETGRLGGRPRKESPPPPDDKPNGSGNSPNPKPRNNPDGFQEITQTVFSENPDKTLARHQTPDTRHQTPEKTHTDPGGSGARASATDLAIEGRKQGIDCAPHQPQLIAIAEQGVSVETFRQACAEAKSRKPAERIPVGYVVAILTGWAQQAQQVRVAGAAPPAARAPVLSAAAQAAARATAMASRPRQPTSPEPETIDATATLVRIG